MDITCRTLIYFRNSKVLVYCCCHLVAVYDHLLYCCMVCLLSSGSIDFSTFHTRESWCELWWSPKVNYVAAELKQLSFNFQYLAFLLLFWSVQVKYLLFCIYFNCLKKQHICFSPSLKQKTSNDIFSHLLTGKRKLFVFQQFTCTWLQPPCKSARKTLKRLKNSWSFWKRIQGMKLSWNSMLCLNR